MAKKNKKKAAPRLSLCMIARDEAAFLQRCLTSVKGLADEIIVVDTGSTDDTAAVAAGAGARVIESPWEDDFAQARNAGLAAAKGRWILVLDCDETIDPADQPRLRQAMAAPGAQAYYLTTRNYTREFDRAEYVPCRGEYAAAEGDYPGWFPSTKVRLFRRRPDWRFEGAVHELVEPAVVRTGGRIDDCPVPVHHYGHVEKERPADHYLAIGEEKLRRDPDDLLARYELALVYRNAGRQAEALAHIDAVVAGMDKGAARPVHLQEELVRLVRGDILDRSGRAGEAEEAYRQVLERFSQSYQAHNNLGSLLERRGAVDQARQHYSAAAAIAPDHPVVQRNRARLEAETQQGTYRLSVCLIARDEEAVLGRCLESVRGLADQIVVVDTGSADRTVEIAAQHGAAVGHFAWCDDFAQARNASLDMADGDWVLWLDADDYLEPAQRDKLAQLKGQAPVKAYSCVLVNEGQDRTRFRQIKMFPRRPGIRFRRPVHESVLAALEAAGVPVEVTDVEVRHSGYADAAVSQRKKAYYNELMLRWIEQHPEDHYVRFRIGHTLYTDRRYDEAQRFLQGVVEAGAEAVRPRSVYAMAAVFYGRSLLEQGRLDEAQAALDRAHALQPEQALANLSLGDALVKLGRYSEALPYLEKAAAGQVDAAFPLDLDLVGYSAHFFAAQCHEALQRRPEALAALRQARRLAPQRPEAAQMLERLEGRPEPVDGGRRLSLCMIVRDEEQRLGRCLESVRGLVDEIVVVDTGSTDRTVEIAAKHGAVIGHFAWCDDFAQARNASLKLASGDWILWLDADDVLPGEYHGQIRQMLGQGADKSYFFLLDDQGYENVSCLQMRLFPNLPGVEFEMPIHEQVTPSLGRLGLEMVPTQVRVLHTGYTTPEIVRAKKDRYLKIMEKWLEGHPQDYIVRSHVALTYHSTGRLEEALEAYRLIIEESTCLADRNYVVYTTALLFSGRTCLKMERYPEALGYIQKAYEQDPDYLLTRLSLAEAYDRLEQPAEVVRHAAAVIDGGRQNTFFPVDQRELAFAARILRAKALQQQGDMAAAVADFEAAAAMGTPRRGEALGGLALLYKGQGQAARALQVLEEAQHLEPDQARHPFDIGILQLEAGHLDEARAAFEEVLRIDPDHGPAWLNIGLIAKTRGQIDEAEAIYRKLLQREPDHIEAGANLAHLLLGAERHEEAAAAFAEVRRRAPDLLDINLGLLAASSAVGTFDTQVAAAVAAQLPEVETKAEDWSDVARAAAVCQRLGQALQARQMPKIATLAYWCQVNLQPGDTAAQHHLGGLLMEQGLYWQAIGRFEAVLLQQPRDGEAFRRLGDCYRSLGVEDAARQCYERSRAT